MAIRCGALLLSTMILLALPWLGELKAQTSDEGTVPQQQELSAPPATQVELTADAARRAIDTFLEVQGKYGESALDDPSDPKAITDTMKTAGIYDKVTADVTHHGFGGVEDWAKTFTSVGLAASFVREGQDAGSVDRQIADLEKDEAVPQAMKDATIAMLRQMRPSENNIAVAKALIDDPDYRDKVDRVLTSEGSGEVE
jgi:hypothetical protein